MNRNGLQKLVFAFFLAVAAAAFFNSPGTGDVRVFEGWVANASIYGVVDGFAANNMDYPPLSTLVLRFFHLFFEGGLDGTFHAVKGAVTAFLLLGCAAAYLFRREATDAVLFYAAFAISAVGLGYIDVIPAALILIALLALRGGRMALFSVFFSIACFVKWQPVILLPLCLMYAANHAGCATRSDRVRSVTAFAAPLALISLAVVVVYGFMPMLRAFAAAAGHTALSANALNLNWVVTWAARVFDPELHGPLKDGVIAIIWTPAPLLKFGKALFFILYAALSLLFVLKKRGYEEFLFFGVLLFATYFMFNTGVHENHLAVPLVFALALYMVDPTRLALAAGVALVFNLNLLIFYGLSGSSMTGRVLFGLDVTLALALSNLALYLLLLVCALTKEARALRRRP